MAKAKKLPSGSWRCLAYSHSEPEFDPAGNPVIDPKTKKQKQKRIYESFTSDNPTPAGKREAELAAAEFQASKSTPEFKKRRDYGSMTLTEAIDKYIESREMLNRSPTTIQDYRCIQKNGFQDLMDAKLKELDEQILQEAINVESKRPSNGREKGKKPISAKRLKNEWGLITAVLYKYRPGLNLKTLELPQTTTRVVELPAAKDVLRIIKGTDIELPVLLAAWLSFSMSEVRGLTKSKSISGNYISIREVVVTVGGKPIRKEMAKNPTRNRRHRIPPYIQKLIEQVKGDVLVPLSGNALYHRWIKLLDDNHMEHITFHDLRHLNASVMALLRIPDKYAQERGGWKSDKVMKGIYMQTFSEEREKVDDIVDDYFDSLIDKPKEDFKDKMLPEDIMEMLKTNNPDGWYDALLRFMQHEMQHDNKKAQ